MEDYSRAIELDPKYACAYCNRGDAYAKLGEYQRALKDYSRAIELDPAVCFSLSQPWDRL
ncbi:MAG: tetratricopeptide repeat protein [Ardenticatenia bacterium]|nr:tetratricopeptide repeat protein [Ardenticatenia bacterium]